MLAPLWIAVQISDDAIGKHEGHGVSTAGDSFAAAFTRAGAAVRAPRKIRVDWPGLHAGHSGLVWHGHLGDR
jgi:hypothetical protein